MEQAQHTSVIKLLVTIVDRGKGKKAAQMYAKHGLFFHLLTLGKGTATSEVLDYLGLGETEKSVLFSLASAGQLRAARDAMVQELNIRKPGNGILFTIPLSGINAQLAAALAQPEKEQQGGSSMDSVQHHVILAIVNQGYSEEVVAAARDAGAKGGTLLHAHLVDTEKSERFFGISICQERDIVAILVNSEQKQAAMKAILHKAGRNSKAQGMVLALPVDSLDGLVES